MASPKKDPGKTQTGRKKPVSKEHIVDQTPRVDPITNKPEIPGTASSRARLQPRDNAALRVRATRMLYYKLKRYSAGDVFTLADADDFASNAMAWEREMTPEARTTSQETINRENVEVAKRKAAERSSGSQSTATGSNVI